MTPGEVRDNMDEFIFEEMDFTYKVEQKATRESSYTNKYKDAQV